jgi:hemoglobin
MTRVRIVYFSVFATILAGFIAVSLAVAQPPVTTPGGAPPADAGPLSRAEIYDHVVQGLSAALEIGVPLFNKGDHQGCYQIYQGALLAAKPLLVGKPELAQGIQARLDRAATLATPSQRAFELRRAIDEVRWTFRKALWDRLGGEAAVVAVVHDFTAAVASDPKVNFTRNGQYKLDAPAIAALERKLVELISSATGGPLKYSGKDMKAVHAGMRITDDEFSALAAHFVATLRKYRVPQADLDELVGIVGATKKDIVESGAVAAAPVAAAPITPPPSKRSLWDRLGGDVAVKAVVHDFVVAAAADPKVNFTRGGQYKLNGEDVAKLETRLVEFISSQTGGSIPYAGRSMRAAHIGMKITDEEFNAMAVDLAIVLKKYSVPQQEIDELMTLIGGTRKDIVGQ